MICGTDNRLVGFGGRTVLSGARVLYVLGLSILLSAAVSRRFRLCVISRASIVTRLISLLRWPLCTRLKSRWERRLERGRVVKCRALHVRWLLPLLRIIRLLYVLLLHRWLGVLLVVPTTSSRLLVSAALQLLYVLILFIRRFSVLIILSTAVLLFTTAFASAASAATATTSAGVAAVVLLLSGLVALLLLLTAVILTRYYVLGMDILLSGGNGRLHKGGFAVLRLPILGQLTGRFDRALHVVVEQIGLQLRVVPQTVCKPVIGYMLELRRCQCCCPRNSHDLVVKVGQTLTGFAVNTGHFIQHLSARDRKSVV